MSGTHDLLGALSWHPLPPSPSIWECHGVAESPKRITWLSWRYRGVGGKFDTDTAKDGLNGGLRLQQSWKWKTQMGERGALPNHSTPTPAICSLEHVSLGWGAAAWGSEGSRCGGFSRRHSHCAHPWTPQPPPGVHEGSLKAYRARTGVSALVTLVLLQNLSPSDSLGPETNCVL